MELSQRDFDEVELVGKLLMKIDNLDLAYVESVMDDIQKRQPFILSIISGLRMDVTPLELEEIVKLHFLIWDYFKSSKNVQTIKITEELFEKVLKRNFALLQSAEGISEDQQAILFGNDLQNLKAKALMMAVLFRFKDHPALKSMLKNLEFSVLLGMKALIECLEIISMGKK